jgi:hypothetical protein
MTPAEKLVHCAGEFRRLGEEQVRALLEFIATEQAAAVVERTYVGFSRILGPVSEEDTEGW